MQLLLIKSGADEKLVFFFFAKNYWKYFQRPAQYMYMCTRISIQASFKKQQGARKILPGNLKILGFFTSNLH